MRQLRTHVYFNEDDHKCYLVLKVGEEIITEPISIDIVREFTERMVEDGKMGADDWIDFVNTNLISANAPITLEEYKAAIATHKTIH